MEANEHAFQIEIAINVYLCLSYLSDKALSILSSDVFVDPVRAGFALKILSAIYLYFVAG